MRCPDCKHQQKYRDGARCGKCGYQFVFRKKDDKISDSSLQQMIQRLSDNGHYAFTATQLALEICRSWRGKQQLIGGVIFVTIIALGLFFVIGHWGISLIALAVGALFALGMSQWRKTALPFHTACALIRRYHQAHPISALADGMAFQQQTAAVDLQDLNYAPERILVVERDELVDLLIRNRFHLTTKTAVLSRTGYPTWVLSACQNFLRQHPNTPVQLLHDASLRGFHWHAQLTADPHWILAGHRLMDLGLSSAALHNNSRLPWLPVNDHVKGGVLSAQHPKMLSLGHRLPVDCVGPKSLLNLLSAAVISGTLTLAAADALGEIGVEVDYG
jgi:hypothetical protein